MASQLTVDNIVGATTANTVHLPGHVIQVVSAEKTDTTAYNSTLGTWTDAGLSCTITPKFNNSKILVQVDVAVGNTVAVFNYVRVVRNIGGGSYTGENGAVATGNKGDIFRVHEQQLDTNTTIASTDNALAAGPLTIASSVTLTVSGNLTIV